MTSGLVSATASKSMPSFSSKSTGVVPPSSLSFASTQGRTPSPSSSPKLAFAIPTGTIPRASGTSWLAQATVATRSGFSSMVVLPNACSTVIGNDAELPPAAVVLGLGRPAAGGERYRGGEGNGPGQEAV